MVAPLAIGYGVARVLVGTGSRCCQVNKFELLPVKKRLSALSVSTAQERMEKKQNAMVALAASEPCANGSSSGEVACH